MTHPMMECGHAANATSAGKPCCAICDGPASRTIAKEQPNLTGRTMRCTYTRKHPDGKDARPSDINAAFFAHHPDKPNDEYYCGCFGWN